MATLNIISFNILDPKLCNHYEFIGEYNPVHLQKNKRKEKIMILIKEYINLSPKPIICLQEVSAIWKGDLEKLFIENGYNFYSICYGILGIGIAIPNNITISKIEYIKIGDYINANSPDDIYVYEEQQREKKRENDRKESTSLFSHFITYVEEYKLNKQELHDEIKNIIEEAKTKKNYAIRITIEVNNKSLIIYNYHMPCSFKKPIIQTMHIDAFKKLMYEHRDIPTIWAGDFNIKPSSNEFKYLTSGKLIDEHRVYIPIKDYSSYTLQNCFEAEFTCFSHTKFGGEFKGTIDYIMIKNIVSNKAYTMLQTFEKMPNNICPSDHLPICANLRI